MVNIHGKNYVEVKDRILAFNTDHPDWAILTEVVSNDNQTGSVIMKAIVKDESDRIRATGHAHEFKGDKSSMVNATSWVENCETSCVGRALGMLGYGIDESFASADEIKIAVQKKEKVDKGQIESVQNGSIWEEVEVPFGKNKGKKLGELTANSRKWYIEEYEPNNDYPESIAFRKALDNCAADSGISLEQSVPDEIAEQVADPELDEDVPF